MMKENKELENFLESELGRPLTTDEKKQAMADDDICKKVLNNNSKVAIGDGSIVVAQSNNVTINQTNTINRSAKSVTLFSVIALFITAIIVLSIVLPLTLINQNGNNGNGGGDYDIRFKQTPRISPIDVCEFFETVTSRNLRFFHRIDDVVDIDYIFALAFRVYDKYDESKSLAYYINNLMIGIMESGNPVPVEAFNMFFLASLNDEWLLYSTPENNELMMPFRNATENFYIENNTISVMFEIVPSHAVAIIKYNNIEYFIKIQRAVPEVLGDEPITKQDLEMILSLLF